MQTVYQTLRHLLDISRLTINLNSRASYVDKHLAFTLNSFRASWPKTNGRIFHPSVSLLLPDMERWCCDVPPWANQSCTLLRGSGFCWFLSISSTHSQRVTWSLESVSILFGGTASEEYSINPDGYWDRWLSPARRDDEPLRTEEDLRETRPFDLLPNLLA